MSKNDGSRFDDLFSAAQKSRVRQESESEPTAPMTAPKSKSTNPDYIRTTVYLPKQLHKRLKAAAADEEKEMSDIVAESIAKYLEERQGQQRSET